MNLIILLRLLIAHILSDFILQPNLINNAKKGYKKDGITKISTSSQLGFLFLHAFIHAAASYLFIAQWENWIVPLLIFLSHFVIDYIKSRQKKENIYLFLIDQIAHISVLFLIWIFAFGQSINIYAWIEKSWMSTRLFSTLIAYIIILKPTSIILNLFFKRWTPTDMLDQSLPNAGKWIGYLERTLILTFILTNHLEGIGFLLAAKSIFRFGELSKAKEIKTTEYVLIGTLASFTTAIIVGLLLLNPPLI
ncbi:MAG: DUF3307 domain-containing protein [Massilibacteroides sp.]|nr:DUF3307 domain-containing protein [Massilibacteroides sp.]MDD3061639.1 DUF3307 domain-containing protein [Massilibacteroides sp.]MDD4114898.1 DUF3307 domain-containing protein [Massilibacteroides sp.]MDD4659977.1 DUF3307 domain-containing protein [Massilibacteroides sp.]